MSTKMSYTVHFTSWYRFYNARLCFLHQLLHSSAPQKQEMKWSQYQSEAGELFVIAVYFLKNNNDLLYFIKHLA